MNVTPRGRFGAHIDVMPEFPPEQQRPPDASTLRRIALLVMRASQDDDALRGPMKEIGNVIDQLKKDVALGLPFGRDDVFRLDSLIDQLTRMRSRRGERDFVHTAIVTELRDLGHILSARVTESGH